MWIISLPGSRLFGSVFVFGLHLIQYHVQSANLTDVQKLFDHAFSGYNHRIFPVIDHNQTVEVAISLRLVSINNFVEMSGELDLTMLFYMTWTDERLMWNPDDYGGKLSILTAMEDIWKPQFFIIQSLGSIQEVGNISLQPRIWYNGSVSWNTGGVLKVSCSVDVTYFPFDIQICQIMVTGWAYTSDEVNLTLSQNYVSKQFFSANSRWDWVDSKVYDYSKGYSGFPPTIMVNITLKRRSEFFIVYIFVPIIFLGLINDLVFLMPVNSGERTSVAVTVFLSFVVYMEMVNGTVPESSSPIAYIYYYIMFMLVYSSAILFLCIISLRIHDIRVAVPRWIKYIVIHLRCWCCLKKKTNIKKVSPIRSTSLIDTIADKKEDLSDVDSLDDILYPEVTWHIVGDTFDKYIMLSMYVLFFAFTINTFHRLYTNNGF